MATTGFSEEALDVFMRREIPGLAGPMRLDKVGGGQSNPTFFVSFFNRRLVLR
jgi:aminoglycoside phosphotransferase (APT) family kinase protein